MVQIASRLGLVGAACLCLLGSGCSLFRPAATSPQTVAPDVPPANALNRLVAGVDHSGGHVLSPDGKKLLWHVVAGDAVTTMVRDADGGITSVFRLGRNFPYWAYDSRHLILEQERGIGQTQIILVDTRQPEARPVNLTPWSGSRSNIIHIGTARSNKLTFISNQRDAAAFDVYTADLDSGKVEMVLQNNGDVVQWVMDEDGTVGARVRRQDDHSILQVMNKSTHTWKSVYKWQQADTVRPVRIERDAGTALLVSNAGRDKLALVELRLADNRR